MKSNSKKSKPYLIVVKIIFLVVVVYILLKNLFPKNKKKLLRNRKNILVIGGGSHNKGALAMTYVAIDLLKKKYPKKEIIVLAHEKLKFSRAVPNFKICNWSVKDRLRLVLKKSGEMHQIFKSADKIVDISGFALSSNWGFFSSLNYLFKIALAKDYGIDYQVFPQSMGPFKYPFWQRIILFPLFHKYLNYPSRVFTRESKGVKSLKKFRKRVFLSEDMVLVNGKLNKKRIFEVPPIKHNIDVKPNSILIIPSNRVLSKSSRKDFFKFYNMVIDYLVSNNFEIYLAFYADEDTEICRKIYASSRKNKLHLIEECIDPLYVESFIKNFKMVISSRYHSLIHSFRTSTPVFTIGWAEKYTELLDRFDQEEYVLNVNNLNFFSFKKKFDKLVMNREVESKKIKKRLKEIKKEDKFIKNFESTHVE
ncbi:MAG: polysaccharide pyruvyl transferase family protein [Nanoarchaeota archaeon]